MHLKDPSALNHSVKYIFWSFNELFWVVLNIYIYTVLLNDLLEGDSSVAFISVITAHKHSMKPRLVYLYLV